MNKIFFQIQNKNENILIKELNKEFHGKLIIHFANGIPRKNEINFVEDILINTQK